MSTAKKYQCTSFNFLFPDVSIIMIKWEINININITVNIGHK